MLYLTSLALFVAAASPAVSDEACNAPAGAAEFLANTPAPILLLGELHGTNEAPAAADAFVCLALARGETVVLALERTVDEQPLYDAYIASDGGEAAQRTIVSSERWMTPFQDGRSSAAMLDLIERTRQRIADGAALSLRAVDRGEPDADLDDLPRPRDQAMSRRLQALAEDVDRVILIVGNGHAQRNHARFGDRVLETIGSLTPREAFHAINLVAGSGESWNCQLGENGQPTCAVYPTRSETTGDPRVLQADEIAANSYLAARVDDYDSFVYLGPSSGSLPAYRAFEGLE